MPGTEFEDDKSTEDDSDNNVLKKAKEEGSWTENESEDLVHREEIK